MQCFSAFFEHIFCKVLTHELNRRDGGVVHNIKQGWVQLANMFDIHMVQ